MKTVPERIWHRRFLTVLSVLLVLYISYIVSGFFKGKPSVSKSIERQDVIALFQQMVASETLTTDDPIYQQILKMGSEAIPQLEKIALDRNIKWHFAAYYMIGQIHDRSAIPFLIEGMNSNDEEIRRHAVWGLDCTLRKGFYNEGDEKEAQIVGRYKEWWEKHKHEFAQ